ncbi:MAG: beta-glucosidase [Catenulispora sp.]|nr:beta-glucosidase [Catenulispora sp.]
MTDHAPLPPFPAGFHWGTSSSAYQVEGAAAEDGKGVSIWDTFVRRPDAVRGDQTGDVACDHYHRYPEDIELMADLGVTAYRFSTAWTRVQPDGSGAANPAGLAFYDRLVDALLDKGITPFPTLFHWDLPQALEDRDGWLARDTAYRFAEYAALVADRLADRVEHWITLNEPFIHLAYGYAFGVHAPGRALMTGAIPVAHHQLLAHGLAVSALRSAGAARVLIANNLTPVWAASSAPRDQAAADAYDALHNRLFMDPILLGRYPDLAAYGSGPDLGGTVRDGDLAVIAAPLDGLGVNYYNPTRVAAPGPEHGLPFQDVPIDGVPRSAFDWPVVPDGLREVLLGLRERYGSALPPVYITENGTSVDDKVVAGRVADSERIAFLDGHIRALAQAMAAGVDVRGYLTWTLMDNFEWAEGFTQRFGLVYVDHRTQTRTPKDSYYWLRDRLAELRHG